MSTVVLYTIYMKKRYILILFVALFGFALWGLVHTVIDSTPVLQGTPPVNTVTPVVPGAPEPQPTNGTDIVVDTPSDGQTITSPITITGKAKGNWFFEGTFPIALTNVDGSIVATGVAHAQGNWMTTDYVPFASNLAFVAPQPSTGSSKGYLVFKNDNPSGDSSFDKTLSIKVQW
jgi:hypothetical protein